MNKKFSIGVMLTFIAIAMAVTVTLTMFFSQRLFNEKVADLAEREAMYNKLAEVDKYIRANELGAIDETALGDQLVRGYVSGLRDTYAQYYTAAEYAAEITSLSGQMIGIGISTHQSDDGYIRVVSVYEDSPAQTAGLLAEDLIIKVDTVDVTKDTYQDAVDQLGNGEIGSNVTLVVRRQNEDLEVICTRREIEVKSVQTKIFSETVGYIRIDEFSAATVQQFDTALAEVRAAGVTSLVIDLRDNVGGSIESMANIVDILAPEGEIVKAVYSSGVEKVLHRSTEGEVFLPMVLVQNGRTASSSELMISALQDYGKARTVGTTSYGKFVMQEIHQFTDGSACKLTTAQLYSPLGNSYNGTGITPDYEVVNTDGELQPVSLLDPARDEQLAKAIEVALDWSKSYDYPTGGDELLPPPNVDQPASTESAPEDETSSDSESGLEVSSDASIEESTDESTDESSDESTVESSDESTDSSSEESSVSE